LNEDILSVLLQAESEYHAAVENAVENAGIYTDDCRKKQSAYIEVLKQDWDSFEKAESDKLENMLLKDEQKMEAEMEELRKRLKISQSEKADIISERLKEEVLSLYGNR